MGDYIAAKEGDASPVLAEFEKVQKLAKVQKNPFLYETIIWVLLYKKVNRKESPTSCMTSEMTIGWYKRLSLFADIIIL